jgi:hypothetical protein
MIRKVKYTVNKYMADIRPDRPTTRQSERNSTTNCTPVFPVNSHFTDCFTLIVIYHPGLVQ